MYVRVGIKGSKDLRCTITPKVHLMLEHVEWQMTNIRWGLGDKMEDWVERLHQTEMRLRQRFCTVQNPVIRALAWEKANSRSSHPDVIAHTNAVNAGNKHFLSVVKVDNAILTRQKRQRDMGRYEAMKYFDKEVNKKLTWSVIFDDVKAGGEGEECDISSAMP